MVIFCFLEAKHKIALLSKSVHRPSKRVWVEGILQCLALERLMCVGKYNTYVKIWCSFVEFLEGEDFITVLQSTVFILFIFLIQMFPFSLKIKINNHIMKYGSILFVAYNLCPSMHVHKPKPAKYTTTCICGFSSNAFLYMIDD